MRCRRRDKILTGTERESGMVRIRAGGQRLVCVRLALSLKGGLLRLRLGLSRGLVGFAPNKGCPGMVRDGQVHKGTQVLVHRGQEPDAGRPLTMVPESCIQTRRRKITPK